MIKSKIRTKGRVTEIQGDFVTGMIEEIIAKMEKADLHPSEEFIRDLRENGKLKLKTKKGSVLGGDIRKLSPEEFTNLFEVCEITT